MSEFSAVCFTREDAHQASIRAYSHAQALLADGEQVLIECRPATQPVKVQQRRFLHGPVLGQISEQARVHGERFVIDVWKEHFRRMFVGDHGWRWESPMKLPGQKRATPRRIRASTEELGVRDYAKLIDQIIDYAAHELGVVFQFTHEEQALLSHKPTRRKGDADPPEETSTPD